MCVCVCVCVCVEREKILCIKQIPQLVSEIDVTLLTSFSDIYVIYLIHMQMEETVVNGRSTACHRLKLVLDLNQKVLKFLVFSSNSFPYFSVFVVEPQFFMLMEDVVLIIKMFSCFDSVRIFYILSVVVQSYVKKSF